jgi:hypothetical protein
MKRLIEHLGPIALITLLSAVACGDDTTGSGGGGNTSQGGGGNTSQGGGGAGGGIPDVFACVGNVEYPQAPAATVDFTRAYYHFSAAYGDPGDLGPFEGVTVSACAVDTDCSTPLDSDVTDAMGEATVTLPTPGVGFEGYLLLTGTDVVPIRTYMLPPVADAESRWMKLDWKPVVLLTDVWANFALANQGGTIDPTKGHVIASVMDCESYFTDAVTVTLDGNPSDFASSGDSVFFNVNPGMVEIVAKLEDGTEVARLSYPVVAGEITAANFGPTPTP